MRLAQFNERPRCEGVGGMVVPGDLCHYNNVSARRIANSSLDSHLHYHSSSEYRMYFIANTKAKILRTYC